VGTYNDDMVQSTLQISELGGSDTSDGRGAPNIGPGAQLRFGAAARRLHARSACTKSILAGGSSPASAAKSGCEGSVSSAPDIQIFFEPGDADLTFRVERRRGHNPADQYAERPLLLRRRRRRRRRSPR
jgi:hypothetical protein